MNKLGILKFLETEKLSVIKISEKLPMIKNNWFLNKSNVTIKISAISHSLVLTPRESFVTSHPDWLIL